MKKKQKDNHSTDGSTIVRPSSLDSQINGTLLFCPTIYIFIFFFEEIQSDLFQKSIWNKLINTTTREGSCFRFQWSTSESALQRDVA